MQRIQQRKGRIEFELLHSNSLTKQYSIYQTITSVCSSNEEGGVSVRPLGTVPTWKSNVNGRDTLAKRIQAFFKGIPTTDNSIHHMNNRGSTVDS